MGKTDPVDINKIHTLVEGNDITIWWEYDNYLQTEYRISHNKDSEQEWFDGPPSYPIAYDQNQIYNNLFYKFTFLYNTKYNFKIKAKNGTNDDSDWSEIVSATTDKATQDAPTGLVCETVPNTINIKLIWDNISILYGIPDQIYEIQKNQPSINNTWQSVWIGAVPNIQDDQGIYHDYKIIENLIYSTSYKFRIKSIVPDYYDSPWTESQIIITPACLLKGTKVRTIQGFKNIENIKVGDFIISQLRVPVKVIKTHNWKIKWSNQMHKASKVYVLENYKSKTFLSSYHKYMVDNEMVCACNSNLRLARKEEICDKNNEYELFHIQVDDHEKHHLLVNGDNIVESWDGKFSY